MPSARAVGNVRNVTDRLEAALPLLFRDERFVIVDKPAGLPVHGGPRGGMSVESYFPLISRRRSGPWLAHRLDADTTGCLVIALRRAALLEAQACFAEGRAEKTYWALVRGGPAEDAGVMDRRLRKISVPGRGWRMRVDGSGETALTEYRVLGRADGVSWLALRPRTGRTHQIRVHCADAGFPLLGDALYGGPPGALQLLARAIVLPLMPLVSAVAPVPRHMREALAGLGFAGLSSGPSDL